MTLHWESDSDDSTEYQGHDGVDYTGDVLEETTHFITIHGEDVTMDDVKDVLREFVKIEVGEDEFVEEMVDGILEDRSTEISDDNKEITLCWSKVVRDDANLWLGIDLSKASDDVREIAHGYLQREDIGWWEPAE